MKLLSIIYNFLPIVSNKGYDHRFIEKNESELVFQIMKNIDIMSKITYLESRKNEIDDKSKQIIDDYLNYSDIKPANFRNGGLMMDWNFDIE